MADNVTIPASGTGTATPVIATDDISSVHYQKVKLVDGADQGTGLIGGDATNGLDVDVTRLPALVAGSANIGDVDIASLPNEGQQNMAGSISVAVASDQTPIPGIGYLVTVSTDVTRPADTTAYAINDGLSDSISAPTTGGFTFSNCARISGGAGIITDAIICASGAQATPLQGEIWLFTAAVTAVNDNAAFTTVTDSEIKTCVGKIPFTQEAAGVNNFAHTQNLNIGFVTSGSANLRFLIRVKNAYVPVSAEVFTFILKIIQVN